MYRAPIKVSLDVTRRCNLACVHCNRVASGSHRERELTTEELKKLMDQLANMGVVALPIAGGEPLLREDLIEVLEYAAGRGLLVSLGTNATLMKPAVAQALRQLTESVLVSLDGATPEVHDRIRGVGGAFQAAVEGIKMLLRAGCQVVVEATAMSMNYDEFLEIMALSSRLGVSEFLAHRCVPVGRAAQNFQQILPRGDAVTALLQKVKQKGEEMQARINVKVSLPAYETSTNDPLARGCQAGELICSVGAIGDVFPCCYFTSYPDMSAGNIRKMDFQDIWLKSPLLNRFRDTKASILTGKCKSCERKETCLGGCKAAAYAIFGDMFAGDPQCPYSAAA
jgi:radical SAM protein with 4Fe4S-binding SPASM domain